VLCEKPFAANAQQAEAMCDAVERAGVIHLLGTEFRYSPGNALLARVVQSGRTGGPIDAQFARDVPFVASDDAEVPAWWRDNQRAGGWLGASGSHVIDQIRTTLGDIESVSAFLSIRDDRLDGADDGFNTLFKTTSGASVAMRSCARSHAISGSTIVVGSDATAMLQGEIVSLHTSSGIERLEMPDKLEVLPPSPPPTEGLTTTNEFGHSLGTDFGPFTRLSEVMLGLIESRDVSHWPKPATFRDGLACQRVIDAIHESNAHEGARQSIRS
jgi:predicted dehydrogenase